MAQNYIPLMGGICGDIIGSTYEFHSTKFYEFPLFTPYSRCTDDTVLTCAVAEWLMNPGSSLANMLHVFGHKYINAGFGGRFFKWLIQCELEPYNSFGNGSGMRVAPVAYVAKTIEECLDLAKKSAEVTHNHPEGIKGAQAIAASIFLALHGKSKEEIKKFVTETFGYDLERDTRVIALTYEFDVTCQGSVPESILCFLESESYEDAVRRAVSMGGDADTMADMAGEIAYAYYKEMPEEILNLGLLLLTDDLKNVVEQFSKFIEE